MNRLTGYCCPPLSPRPYGGVHCAYPSVPELKGAWIYAPVGAVFTLTRINGHEYPTPYMKRERRTTVH